MAATAQANKRALRIAIATPAPYKDPYWRTRNESRPQHAQTAIL